MQAREKKTLSASGLLKTLRKSFASMTTTIPKRKSGAISLVDAIMSGVAMFSLKSPSLLSFDQSLKEKTISHNLKTLYGIEKVPSDTYMRELLDEVDPSALRKAFTDVFTSIQRGKMLEQFSFLDTYLISLDGTNLFNSNKVHCKNCCEKVYADGKKEYYHMMLGAAIIHPAMKQVIPLCPELIDKQDGVKKNDCESRAISRFLASFKKEHPRLRATFLLDALSANAPQINELKKYDYDFIINAKPGSNKFLFDWIQGLTLDTASISVNKNHYQFRYINNIPLNGTQDAPMVNFLECIATEIKGRQTKTTTFTWVTNHKITKKNVYTLMRGGRGRWKIENETFNTLKNQGYQFEHNFGHGKKNLTSVFCMTMVLAFLIDQIQEAACGLFQASLKKMHSTRSRLWERIRCYFLICYLNSWESLFNAIIHGTKFNTS